MVVLLVVIFVIISKIANKMSKPAEPEKTIADTWRNDEKRLRAEPNVVVESNASVQPETGQPAAQQPPAEPRKFRELTEDEKAGASQLFELAINPAEDGTAAWG